MPACDSPVPPFPLDSSLRNFIMAPAKRRMNWIGALQRNRVANSLVKTLRIHRLADFGLNRHPLKRKTAHGFTYCVESTASLVVAKEIFDTDMYARAVALVQPVTFIDLGANVGFFPVLLAEVMQAPPHQRALYRTEPSLALRRGVSSAPKLIGRSSFGTRGR